MGARGARDFVHSYGRDGFETPIAARSDSDLRGESAPEDAAFDNEYGAEGTFRSSAGDSNGGGDDDQVFPAGCICVDYYDRCQECWNDDGISDASLDDDPGGGDEVMTQVVVMVVVFSSPPLMLLTRRRLA